MRCFVLRPLLDAYSHAPFRLHLLAVSVKTIYAQMLAAGHECIEVEDAVTATLTFSNGAIGNLMATTSAYPGFLASLSLLGTNGSTLIQGDELKIFAIRGLATVHGLPATAHALQVATGGTKSATAHAANPETPAASGTWSWGVAGRTAVALINALYESARTGRVVTLAE